MDHDPTYEPIVGGHKSYSWEKELRERGLHASANELAKDGDAYFEGPQGHPAPGSGSPRRDRVSASPARRVGSVGGSPSLPSVGASPYDAGFTGSPARAYSASYQQSGGYAASPPAGGYGSAAGSPARAYSTSPHNAAYQQPPAYGSPRYQTTTTTTTYVAPTPVLTQTSTYSHPPAYGSGGGGATFVNTGISPPRSQSPPNTHLYRMGSGSPHAATTPLHQVGGGVDNDPMYEPIIGGHKTHSWEKELRERGLHASANRVAQDGDAFFEGPQGNPAPGSGSPRRDRVSPSPSRRGFSPI